MSKCYENLANAIILKAVEDYRKILRTHSQRPDDRAVSKELENLEQFFHSDFFAVLSNLDPSALIERLKKEVAA